MTLICFLWRLRARQAFLHVTHMCTHTTRMWNVNTDDTNEDVLNLYHCSHGNPHKWVQKNIKNCGQVWRNTAGLFRFVPSQPCADLHCGALGNLHNRFGISFSVLQWPSPPICQRGALVFLDHISSPHPPHPPPSPLSFSHLPAHTLPYLSKSAFVSKKGGKKRRKKKTGQTFPISSSASTVLWVSVSSLPAISMCEGKKTDRNPSALLKCSSDFDLLWVITISPGCMMY